jgi:hypothetical protein
MTRQAAALVIALAVVCAACGAPLLKLPQGPGAPATDGREAFDEATRACRRVSTITLEMAVSGSIGGKRARGRLIAGLASPASARLEAAAPFGQPVFIFTATGDDASLLLPRDNRVLEHGRPGAVLDAVTGVPLDAATLLAVITGCMSSADAAGARSLGDDWRVVPAGPDEVYLNREKPGGWRLVATLHRPADSGWRAEYRDFKDGLPQTIRLASARSGAFDLQLALSQVELNTTLGADVFRLQVPPTASPITLDELKASGPLGANGR